MKENWEDLFRVRYNGLPPAGGRVLVAEPFLRDGGFGRSVVYLTDHNEEGSVGFVLNKPLRVSVESVVAGLEGVDFPVYYGGPVGRDSLYYIHRRVDIPGAVMVGDGVFHGGDFDVVTRLAREGRLGEGDIRFFAGYSGWSAGQLEGELREDSWLVGEVSRDEVFGGTEGLWERIMRRLGARPAIWSMFPEDPRMN